MAPLRRRTVLALTAIVWVAAIGSATGLAYALNRPLKVRAIPETQTATAEVASTPALEVPTVNVTPATENTLSIPTLTITAKAPQRMVTPRLVAPEPLAAPEPLPDIAKMKCAEWRELDMGSGRVQICE